MDAVVKDNVTAGLAINWLTLYVEITHRDEKLTLITGRTNDAGAAITGKAG